MDQDEALKLLRCGKDGVAKWNRRRGEGEETPNLSRADLSRADLRDANLSRANLSRANLRGANFSLAKLSRADLSRADLRDANFIGANLIGADLSLANLSRADLSRADLSRADLSGANLIGANFRRANLSDARLRDSNLSDARLRDANLSDARLIGAILRRAALSLANLSRADLSRADLRYANLIGANLSRANLSSATVGWTTFADVDLSSTNGIDAIVHQGPSSVSLDTLQKSGEAITDTFLIGCGRSPWECEMAKLYNPDLTANEVSNLLSVAVFSKRTVGPLYFGGVFISYSHTEKGVADKLRERLHKAGASVWLDRHDAVAGNLNKQIQREIRLRDIVVLILSDTSVKSDWVEHELKSARTKEKEEKRDVLCPISVDESWKAMMGNPNWGHLSDKLILDFSAWKTEAFDKQFDKLLKGMKINYEVRK